MLSTPMISLAEIPIGTRVRLVHVDESFPESKRLLELGLTPGTELEILRVAPLGDPVEVAFRGFRLCFRKAEAKGLSFQIIH